MPCNHSLRASGIWAKPSIGSTAERIAYLWMSTGHCDLALPDIGYLGAHGLEIASPTDGRVPVRLQGPATTHHRAPDLVVMPTPISVFAEALVRGSLSRGGTALAERQ